MSKQAAKIGELLLGEGSGESPYSAMARELIEVYIRQVCLTDHICLKKALLRLERDIILHVLDRTNGNQYEASRILGLKPNTLHYKLLRLGISPVHRYEEGPFDKSH
jgi:transcriptional regulator with GAF, ATPase, and Fis domain